MKKSIIFISLFSGTMALAQIQQGQSTVNRDSDFEQQSVTVERNYEPKVEAAEKIKQTPQIESTEKDKLHVEYGLKDVNAESDFETTTIGAEELPVKDQNPYNNYIRAGYGNRATLLIDGYGEYEIQDDRRVGASLEYFSTNGEIPDREISATNSKLAAEAFFKMNFERAEADIRLGGGLHKLNYYGVSMPQDELITLSIDDVSQRYTKVYTSAKYKTFDHPFLEKVFINAGFFGDKYDASESNFDALASFGRESLTELNFLGELDLGASADVNLNFSNAQFDQLFDNKYTQMTVGIAPLLHFANDIVRVKGGVNLQYYNESESGDSDFYIFPKAEVFVTAVPEFGLYGGIQGGVTQNRFQSLYNENPYLLPNQLLKATVNKMEVYAGVRGDIGTNFKYDASAKYQDLENIPFFSKINEFGQSYMQGNSFSAIYDDGTRTALEGNINFLGIANLNLVGNLLFQSYALENFEEAWDKSTIQAKISADYKFLDERLILGGDIFYVDQRYATYNLMTDNMVDQQNLPVYELSPYFDLNLRATYLILDRWAAFVEFQNALNKNYNRFLDYPVQGITGVGGVMFKF